ncbi:hypothetical protein [Corynebacterium sp.]|uniref:hypothetical protein n=1 Tax=Corynebacterium sp. TaxID=1720 RepID=UPI002A918AE6|nr:hypothetical protein [Corynebacterium sp.]MDY5786381.1 hypothetical protein [Corynebacterium sp.]
MYYPVPGHQHVKVLVQQPPAQPAHVRRPPPAARPAPQLKVALDAAFGVRGLGALATHQYAPGVRGHISARRKTNAPAGPVRIVTCHAREGGEFFGTVQAGPRRYAFAARIAGGRLVSFKVL